VYADDSLFISKSSNLIRAVKSEVQRKFQITKLGPATYFLGIEIKALSHGLFLHQHANIQEVLQPTICYRADPARLQWIPGVLLVSQGPK
jgi:Reverse transcriptase (RNA-dependent DNA polymerase)